MILTARYTSQLIFLHLVGVALFLVLGYSWLQAEENPVWQEFLLGICALFTPLTYITLYDSMNKAIPSKKIGLSFCLFNLSCTLTSLWLTQQFGLNAVSTTLIIFLASFLTHLFAFRLAYSQHKTGNKAYQ